MKPRYSRQVIILHFIHIRAMPQGREMGSTDRVCVVLFVMCRKTLKTGTSISVFFLGFFCPLKAVNHVCYFLIIHACTLTILIKGSTAPRLSFLIISICNSQLNSESSVQLSAQHNRNVTNH